MDNNITLDIIGVNEEDRVEIFKYCYEEYIKFLDSDMTSEEFNEYLAKKEYDRAKLVRYARTYALNYLKFSEDEWHKRKAERRERLKKDFEHSYEESYEEFIKYLNSDINAKDYDLYLEEHGLKKSEIFSKARIYALDVLKIDPKEWNDKIEYLTYGRKYYLYVVKEVAKCNDLLEVYQILGNEYKAEMLKRYCNFCIKKYKEIGDEVIKIKEVYDYESIIKKIDSYLQLCELQKQLEKEKRRVEKENERVEKKKQELEIKKEKLLLSSQKLINDFIESNENIIMFCIDNEINRKDFDEAVQLVKICDSDLYEKYFERISSDRSKRYTMLILKMKDIVNKIKYGIQNEENNITRPFDIIDYFQHTKLDYAEAKKIAKEALSNDEFRILCKFMAENRIPTEKESKRMTKEILETGMIIAEKEISIEDKMYIIEFLISNNIPVSRKFFSVAIRRYLDNNLEEVNEGNKKIKVNNINN